MNRVPFYLMLFLLIVAGACSNRQIYDSLQIRQKNECLNLPPAESDECLGRVGKSYDQYEKERQELLKK